MPRPATVQSGVLRPDSWGPEVAKGTDLAALGMTLDYDQTSRNAATDIIGNATGEQAKLPSVAAKVNIGGSLGPTQTSAAVPQIHHVTEVTFPVVTYA